MTGVDPTAVFDLVDERIQDAAVATVAVDNKEVSSGKESASSAQMPSHLRAEMDRRGPRVGCSGWFFRRAAPSGVLDARTDELGYVVTVSTPDRMAMFGPICAATTVFLVLTACSTQKTTLPGSASATTSAATTTPAATTSAFCSDLDAFAVGAVSYIAKAGAPIGGEPLDSAELRRLAGIIAVYGEEMSPTAPADISSDFTVVLTGIATSVGNLKEGAKVIDVVDPVYNKNFQTSWDAVKAYECQ